MLDHYFGIPSYFEQVSLGKVPKKSIIYKFGRNALVTDTEELIASGNIYGLPLTAETVDVTSDDVADAFPSGVGARSITIFGVDGDYNEISETVNIGGTSLNTYLRVFRAYVETAGTIGPTVGGNVGTISIAQSTSGIDMIQIDPVVAQSLCACFTVPAGYTALMWSADTTVGSGKESTNKLKSREFNGEHPFRTKGIRDNFENSVGQQFVAPSRYEEKTDIVFTAISTAAGTSVSGTFLLELIKNEVI